MYDRRKITLFIFVILTFVLAGVAIFLAIQVNESQAPDDSLASGGTCVGVYSESVSYNCVGQPNSTSCLNQDIAVRASSCCDWNPNSKACTSKTSGAPSFCSQMECSGNSGNFDGCANSTIIIDACRWVASSTPAPVTCGGTPIGGTRCGPSNRTETCQSSGNWTVTGGSCGATPAPTPAPTRECTPGQSQCDTSNNVMRSCDNNGNWYHTTQRCGTTNTTGASTTTTGGTPSTTGTTSGSSATSSSTTTGGGSGNPVTCTPNATRCNNGNIVQCLADGTGEVITQAGGCAPQSGTTGTTSTTVGGTTSAPPATNTTGTQATSSSVTTGTTNTPLPDTALISDDLDPILLGMVLIIIGLTLYKVDFRKQD